MRFARIPIFTTLVFTTLVLFLGCVTSVQHKAKENAAIAKQAAQEVRRICSLPSAQRDAEIERIKSESGIVVHCGRE